jgi:hypothetical protein
MKTLKCLIVDDEPPIWLLENMLVKSLLELIVQQPAP